MASKCYIETIHNILSKMLLVENHNIRILVYVGVVFGLLSVVYLLTHQAGCLSNTGSWFCREGLDPALFLTVISTITPGGTILALAVAERNLYDTTWMFVIGFVALIVLGYLVWAMASIKASIN